MPRPPLFLRRLAALVAIVVGVAAPTAAAQTNAVGRVTQIGLGDVYDPLAWVPLRVELAAPGGQAGTYLLRVATTDLDGDRVFYDRPVTLAGGETAGTFWTYFKLPPGGGPNGFKPETDLRVVLADEDGLELARLPVEARPPEDVNTPGPQRRPGRFLLLVGGDAGGSYPGRGELGDPDLVGINRLNLPVGVRTDDLPDRAIGYDAVDAVVWQDADPGDLLDGGGERMAALLQYVRDGGRLIVTHRGDWQALEPLFNVLPVTPVDAVDLPDASGLGALAGGEVGPAWTRLPGPFRHVLAVPKPEALVEAWLDVDDFPDEAKATAGALGDVAPGDRFPMLARGGYGFGCVTWVAIDLSNRALLGTRADPTTNWTAIWSRLLDVGEDPHVATNDAEKRRYDTGDAFRDFGGAPASGVRLAGKSAALVTLAVLFFIAYWLVAGPGVYFWLARGGRAHLSWYAFGVAATIAAILTVGVTSLVLRGPPELRHVSVLRAGGVGPSLALGDLGLYVPRDGEETIRVGDAEGVPEEASEASITALQPPRAAGPLGVEGRARPVTYRVNLGEGGEVIVPYRSTLKKFEARAGGPTTLGIEGTPRLGAGELYPTGTLINTSGMDLRNVHVAYKRLARGRAEVQVAYVPTWRQGQSIASLDALLRPARADGRRGRVPLVSADGRGTATAPPRDVPVTGRLRNDWADQYWYAIGGVRRSIGSPPGDFDDWSSDRRITPAMLSLFAMLPPMTNPTNDGTAIVPLNRGADEWDVTAAISAGRLVVIGEADNVASPLPLTVAGRAVEGTGTTVVQFVLPLERPPATDDETDEVAEEEEPAEEVEAP